MNLPFIRHTPQPCAPLPTRRWEPGPITVVDEAEVAQLAELLAGSVQTGYGNSFIGDAVAKALAERVLKAEYAPPTRFYAASEQVIQAAERRGELRAETAVKEWQVHAEKAPAALERIREALETVIDG